MVEVVRLKNPGMSVTFTDLIRGDVTFDTTELGDFVIARSIDDPLYHFAVVADDGDAKVTHVLRAEEHISNTPRQILILEALGFTRPAYAHLPLILAPDRAKLSKRKHGASVEKYRAQGFLAPALINYLALLGWNPGTEQELFTLDELIQAFDLTHVNKAGAVFDLEKLRWFNRQYLLKVSDSEFNAEVFDRMKEALTQRGIEWNEAMAILVAPLMRERISVYDDVRDLVEGGELDFYFKVPILDKSSICGAKSTPEEAKEHLTHAHKLFSAILEASFDAETLKTNIWDYATEKGRGKVLWPLRYILSGRDKSPDPFSIAQVLGKEATLSRIERAIELL